MSVFKVGLSAVLVIATVVLSACTSTNVTPLAGNVVSISTSAAPVCGRQGAQRVASKQAAAETLRRGFDRFIVAGTQGSSDIRQIGSTPTYADTVASGDVVGNSVYVRGRTNIYGGQPIYAGSHNRELTVVMFRNGDPKGANALDARTELGADWQKKLKSSGSTCF
jgi:hypothetical protein